jgi:hypothetical protein
MQLRHVSLHNTRERGKCLKTEKDMIIWAVFMTAHTFAGLGYVNTGLAVDVVVESVW